ncbi:MAG: ECF transporter S component, partial [Candidatus Izimaplasma sp.]|nr:ECF transporter S component [Candidatus Izimaplasma bacterium]
ILYRAFKKNIFSIYNSLIIAMLAGRAVFGIANVILLGLNGNAYSFSAFIGAAFITSLPGIIFQLIAIPLIVFALERINESERYA